MTPMVAALKLAGVVHLIMAAANISLPRRLRYRENLSRVSPVIRQIFVVHATYIVIVVVLFGALCLLFTNDLAGASRLGRFLSGAMALFWLVRIPLQLFYYDPELRRQNRPADIAYTSAVCFLALVFTLAAVSRL